MKHVVVLLALLPAVAVAQDLPRFDVDKYCESISQIGGGSHSLFNTCVGLEQGAYDNLTASWDGVSARIRRHCAELGAIGGGTYQMVETCVRMEQEAAGGRKTFKP